ncbi:hypothetical protein JCM33374_g3235 [Metschnikowia sp. JCM 33374]|nr:hypothetical protein JCM33374_g3235 [Metschnikowia sp. JCM 33374]
MNDLCFNQDFTCLSVSTPENHRIFNCDPFGEFYSSPGQPADAGSSVGCGTLLLRMLFSTSLTIIVPSCPGQGGTAGPGCGDSRVLKIYNLKQNLKICELTFPSHILDVKLNRKRMVVFLEMGSMYIYDLTSIRLIKVLEVDSYIAKPDDHRHHRVLYDLSSDDRSFLVLPLSALTDSTDLFNSEAATSIPGPGSLATGPEVDSAPISPGSPPCLHVKPQASSLAPYIELTKKNEQAQLAKTPLTSLKDLQRDSHGWILVYDTVNLKPRLIYKAHDSAIAKIAISANSNYIATASTKGTIIRVCHMAPDSIVDPANGKLEITQVTNLRRGHNPANINALKFNLDSTILGCGSESGTVHLFTVTGSARPSQNDDAADFEDSRDFDDGNLSEDEPNPRLSSSEDLNENLANLLLSKDTEDHAPKPKDKEESGVLFLGTQIFFETHQQPVHEADHEKTTLQAIL